MVRFLIIPYFTAISNPLLIIGSDLYSSLPLEKDKNSLSFLFKLLLRSSIYFSTSLPVLSPYSSILINVYIYTVIQDFISPMSYFTHFSTSSYFRASFQASFNTSIPGRISSHDFMFLYFSLFSSE